MADEDNLKYVLALEVKAKREAKKAEAKRAKLKKASESKESVTDSKGKDGRPASSLPPALT